MLVAYIFPFLQRPLRQAERECTAQRAQSLKGNAQAKPSTIPCHIYPATEIPDNHLFNDLPGSVFAERQLHKIHTTSYIRCTASWWMQRACRECATQRAQSLLKIEENYRTLKMGHFSYSPTLFQEYVDTLSF